MPSLRSSCEKETDVDSSLSKGMALGSKGMTLGARSFLTLCLSYHGGAESGSVGDWGLYMGGDWGVSLGERGVSIVCIGGERGVSLACRGGERGVSLACIGGERGVSLVCMGGEGGVSLL